MELIDALTVHGECVAMIPNQNSECAVVVKFLGNNEYRMSVWYEGVATAEITCGWLDIRTRLGSFAIDEIWGPSYGEAYGNWAF